MDTTINSISFAQKVSSLKTLYAGRYQSVQSLDAIRCVESVRYGGESEGQNKNNLTMLLESGQQLKYSVSLPK